MTAPATAVATHHERVAATAAASTAQPSPTSSRCAGARNQVSTSRLHSDGQHAGSRRPARG